MFGINQSKGKVHAALTGVLSRSVMAEVRESGLKLVDKDRLVYRDGNEITIGGSFLNALGASLYDSSWVFEVKDTRIEVRCSRYIHRKLEANIKERMVVYQRVEELLLRLASLVLVKRGGVLKSPTPDPVLLQSHKRYELVRTLSPKEFADIWQDNLKGIASFDQLIDVQIKLREGKHDL